VTAPACDRREVNGTTRRFRLLHGEQRRLSASIGIVVSKEFWGTGVALDALETLLAFLFDELGLRDVHLWTHSGLPKAIGLASARDSPSASACASPCSSLDGSRTAW